MPRKISRVAIREIKRPPEPCEIFSCIKDRPYSFFLDSACDPHKLGRFSFMGCDPFLIISAKGDRVLVKTGDGRTESFRADPFRTIKDLLDRYRIDNPRKDIPFVGGAVGYLSYDMKDSVEALPDLLPDDLCLPDCMLGFYDSVVIYDNLNKRCYISDARISEISGDRLADLIAKHRSSVAGNKKPENKAPAYGAIESNFSKRSYAAAVRRAKYHIKKGDIYQVNISQRFHTKVREDVYDLYTRLRKFSPAPFASFLNFGDVAILSSSPERYVLKRGDYIETRPIKGTRPRGSGPEKDRLMEAELLNSAKDMAEHIMIVDLERNDLGRICRYGSVRHPESAIIERYANVHHLVSTVCGTLRKGAGPVDCLKATFPGGSITGAPKIRSMEIIEELEKVKRSVYTGAIGYIGFDGNMDTSIVIRTFIIKGNDLYFQVGGGIVADSDPEKEYQETLHKAMGLMRALGAGRCRSGSRRRITRRRVCA